MTPSSMDVSVIVAVGRSDIAACLKCLEAQRFPADRFEIILAASAPVAGRVPPNATVLMVSEDNPALKRNTGARHARGELLAFIDDDALAEEHWLQNAVDFFKRYPGVAGVGGPRLLPPEAGFLEKATDILANSKFFGNGHGNWREMQVSNRVPHGMINSCNYFIRKTIFSELGGFNEQIGYGGEDTEFIYRAVRDAGCLFAYTWDLIVYHPPRGFGWGLIKQRFRYRLQNGRMLWVYPRIYLSNWTFSVGLFGITAFLLASWACPMVLPAGLAVYFASAVFVASKYARYDWRFVLLLPPAFAIHHSLYYLAIWAGLFAGLFNRRFIRDVKSRRVGPYVLLDQLSAGPGPKETAGGAEP